jgi:glycolate oxidase FAD binding subunit
MAGALGTLGLITEVSIKCLPLPRTEATIAFDCSADEAIRRSNEWSGQPFPLSATCYHDGRLSVRLSGAQPAVAAAMTKLGGQLAADADAFWVSVRDHAHPFFASAAATNKPLWRLSVKPTAPYTDLGGDQLIEWGGGLRWLAATERVDAAKLRAWASRQGGHATLFRAADKSGSVFHPLDETLAALHRKLKSVFDPQGIFNRGRMIADL